MSKVFEGVFLQGTFTARAVKRTICKRDGHVDEENYSEANWILYWHKLVGHSAIFSFIEINDEKKQATYLSFRSQWSVEISQRFVWHTRWKAMLEVLSFDSWHNKTRMLELKMPYATADWRISLSNEKDDVNFDRFGWMLILSLYVTLAKT